MLFGGGVEYLLCHFKVWPTPNSPYVCGSKTILTMANPKNATESHMWNVSGKGNCATIGVVNGEK